MAGFDKPPGGATTDPQAFAAAYLQTQGASVAQPDADPAALLPAAVEANSAEASAGARSAQAQGAWQDPFVQVWQAVIKGEMTYDQAIDHITNKLGSADKAHEYFDQLANSGEPAMVWVKAYNVSQQGKTASAGASAPPPQPKGVDAAASAQRSPIPFPGSPGGAGGAPRHAASTA